MAKNRGYFNEFKQWYESNYGEMRPRESTPEEKAMRAAAAVRATDQEIQQKREAEEGIDPGFAEYLRQQGITLKRKPPEHVQSLNAQIQSKTLSPLGRQGIFPVGSKELQGNSKKSPYQLAIEQYSRKTGAEEKEASIRNTTPEMHNAFQPFVDESAYRRTREGAYIAEPYTGGLKGSLRPLGGLIGYSVSGLGSAMEGAVNVPYQQITGEKVTPHDTINDFREKAYAEALKRSFQNAFGGKEDGITTKGEEISGFAADVGLSTVGSASKIAVGAMLGIPAAGIMSAGAANDTLAELNGNENIDARQAALVAGLHGGVEAATEGLSLGNLKNFETIAAKSAKGVLKEIGKQMAVEASEEMASEVANSFLDRAYLGREAGFNKAVRGYMDSGMSEGEAKRQAYLDLGRDTTLAGLAGGLSGGLMGGGATVMNYTGMSAAGRNGFLNNYNTAEDYGMIAENVSDETEAGKKAIETARNYENRIRSGERITDAEKGELESLLYETTQAENEKYGTGQYDAIAAAVDTDRGHYAESDAYDRAVQVKMAAENLAAKEAEGKEITAFEKSVLRQLMDAAGELLPAEAHNIEAVRDAAPVKAAQTEPIRTAETERAPVSVLAAVAKPLNPLYERAGARSPDVVNDDGLMNDIASNYAENGSQAFKINYDTAMGIRNYSKAFAQIYNAARYGLKQGEMNTAVTSMLDSGALENIFKSGVRDRQQLDRKLMMGGSYKVRQEQRSGGLVDKVPETPKNLSKVLDTLGKNTGIQFIVTNTARYNGMYKEGDGVVVVDLSAVNPLSTVSHEMTHWMREYNAEGYLKFRDAAAGALMRNGMDLEEEIEKYRDAYREQQGQELARDDAIEEIVADSTGMYLNDEQLLKETVQDNPTMAQRVVEWLKSVCDALKELISDRGLSRAARYMAKDLAVYEKARDLWMQEIETAKDAFGLFEPDTEKKAGDKFKIAEPTEIKEERVEVAPVQQGNNGMRYSLTISEDGETLYESDGRGIPIIGAGLVKQNDIREHKSEVRSVIKSLIKELIGEKVTVKADGRTVEFDSASAREFAYSNDTKRKADAYLKAKFNAVEKAREIIENAVAPRWEENHEEKHRFDAKRGWTKYRANFALSDGGNISMYDAELIIKMSGNSHDYFYDIVKVKESPTRQIRDFRPSNDKLRQLSFNKSIASEAGGSKRGLSYQLDIAEENMPRADLLAENEELKKANEYLTGMLNSYKDLTPSERDIHKVVEGLADEFGYNGDLKPVEEKVGKFYNYLRTAEGIDGAEVTQVAAALANEIVDKAEHVDPTKEKMWKDFRKAMRSTRIYIPESNIADYAPDGWNDFRKEWFGKVIFTKGKEYSNGVYDGTAVYRRLQEQFPDYFTAPADGMTDDEAIHHIMEAFDLQKPMTEPAYRGADKDEVALILGQRILEAYALVGNQDVRAQYNKSYKEFARQAENRIRKGYIKALEEQRIENAEELKRLKRRFDASEIGLEAYIVSKKALLDFEEQKKQAAAKQWRKSRAEYEDSRKKSAYKREIIRNTEKLTRMINQPTDKAHVPVFLLNDLKNVVDHISFTLSPQRKDGQLKQWAQEGTPPRLMKSGAELKTAFTRVTDGLQAITDNGSIYTDGKGTEYYVVVDPDIITCLKQIPDMLTEEGAAAKNLDQLSAYQLSLIRDTMASLNRMIEGAGKFIANEHYKSINEAAEKTIEELSKRKDAVNVDGRIAGGMQSMFRAGMLDAYTYFDIMGESGKAIYDEVRSALDRKIRNTRTAQDYMMEIRKREGLTDREISSWSRELKEIELVTRDRNGNYRKKTARVTDAQIMSLYLLNKRGQARMHIYGNGKNASAGGVKFAAVKAGALKKTDGVTVYKMDEATVNRLIGQLSEKQRAVADAVGHFLTDVTSGWGNEVTMTLYGYKKFTASNYFPIDVDDNTIGKDSKALEGSITLLKNMGSTKSVQQRAYNPLVLHDIFDVYTEQADKMGSYNAFVVATADMQKWFNYKTEETNLQQEMERALGGDANEYFMNLLRDINGSRAKADKYERFYDFAGKYKAARIGANLRVAIQQPTAYARAAAEMDVKYLLKGLWMTPNEAAAEWEKCKEYAPIAEWKDWGYFDINVGRSMKSLILGHESALEGVKEKSMWLAGKMDTVAWVRLWKAAQEQVKDQQPDLKAGSDEVYREAGKVFSHIIDTTQVVDSVLHRTDMMKSRSAYVKSITSFLSEPMKSYNMIYREAMKVKAGDADAKKKLARVIAVYLIGNTLTDAAAAVADAMRNDDRDKEFIEKWFDAFIGELVSAFTDEDMAFSERAKIILLELSDKTGVSNIPFVKNIISRIAGYKQDDMALRWADEVINAFTETGKFVAGKSKQGTLGYLYKISDVGDFFGVSSKNAMKDTGGLLNSFIFPTVERLGIASEDTLRYEELKLMKNIGHKDNLKVFVMEAIRAYADGERELGDRIMEDLIEAGYDDKRIRESIENQLGKEEEFEFAAQAYVDNDMKAYEENRKKLIASGYKEEIVDKKLQDRSDNIMQDIASYSLIADALLSGDADAAETAYDKLMGYKKKRNPEKKPEDIEKEVRKQIKSNISGRYKEDYVNLPKKRAEIKQKLIGIQLKRKRLYTGDDYGKWYKE